MCVCVCVHARACVCVCVCAVRESSIRARMFASVSCAIAKKEGGTMKIEPVHDILTQTYILIKVHRYIGTYMKGTFCAFECSGGV